MSLRRFLFVSVAALTVSSVPAFAGFQFSSPPQRQQQQQIPQGYGAPMTQVETPMPIVPAAPVEQAPLAPMPMEQAIGMQPAPQQVYPVAANNNGGRLVINPYPLQQQGAVATHDAGSLGLDQAIAEQSGQLRPVATPGDTAPSGMIARAAITSRYDGNAVTPPRKPVAAQMDYAASSLTPLPGGQGQNVYGQQAMPAPAPVMPSPAIPVPRAPSSGQYTDAVGFGKELPLALAMSQVVPADYSFSFAPTVDAGATVSWQGGKPWNEVLNDMLAPQGLTAIISGQQVTIQQNI